MTCVIGFCHNGESYVASDSMGSNNHGECATYENPKIFYKDGGFLYGCTSSYRMIQILEHRFIEPECETNNILNYMSKDYSPAVMDCFEKARFAKNECNVLYGGFFVLVYKGSVYRVQQDFSILKCTNNYAAEGSGGELARASMYSQIEAYKIMKQDFDPFNILKVALMAAEEHNSFVRRPFHFIKMDKFGKIERKTLRK